MIFFQLNKKQLNQVLETELSGYRLIDGEFIPIKEYCEIQEIGEVLEKSIELKFEGVNPYCRVVF